MQCARHALLWVAVLNAVTLAAAAATTAPPPQSKTPPPTTPRSKAYIDITGYWVSVVTEDWVYRMLTPSKGDAGSLPVNAEARKAAESWDPQADQAAGEACRANGAAGNIRRPGRLHISWADDKTLKLDFSAGDQTRLIFFDSADFPAAAQPSWQGQSLADWVRVRNWQQFGPPSTAPVGGSLKVTTSRMRAGYLQSNGFRYSANARMTEYFDRITFNGTPWLIVTTVVEDPTYLRDSLYWSTPFKQESNGAHWKAAPCGAN
jgi:hypothetical protein